MSVKSTLRFLLTLSVVFLLSACGGGGGGGGGGPEQSNSGPTAVAGGEQTVLLGSPVTLDGSTSSDPANQPLTYLWRITSAPSGSRSELNDPAAVAPRFMPDKVGTYSLELVVNEGTADSAPATVDVTVNAFMPENSSKEVGLGSEIGQVGETISVPIYAHNFQGLREIKFQVDYDAAALQFESADFTVALRGADTLIEATPGAAGDGRAQLAISYIYDQTSAINTVDLGAETVLGYLNFKILTSGSFALTVVPGEVLDGDSQPIACHFGSRSQVIGYALADTALSAVVTYDPFALVESPYGFDLTGSTIPDPLNTWISVLINEEEVDYLSYLEPHQVLLNGPSSIDIALDVETAGGIIELPSQTVSVYPVFPGGIVVLSDADGYEPAWQSNISFSFSMMDLLFDPASGGDVRAAFEADRLEAIDAVMDGMGDNDERRSTLLPYAPWSPASAIFLDTESLYLYIPVTIGENSPCVVSGIPLEPGSEAWLRLRISQGEVDAMVAFLMAP